MRAIVIYTAYGVPPGKTAKALLFNTTHKDLADRGLKYFADHTKVTIKDSTLFLADIDADIPELKDYMIGHKIVNDLTEDEKTSVKNYLTKKPTMDELGLFD